VDLMEALRASIAQTEQEKGKLETTNTRDSAKDKADEARDEANDTQAQVRETVTDQSTEEKPKSTLTPRKRTTRRAKGA
ncbi:MAG: Ku protein, partial [Bacillota bacterium]|nr:Ku protein [Bacillota bacterium]